MQSFGSDLFDGGDSDDKEEWQSTGDWTGGSVYDQLKWQKDKKTMN